MNKFKTLFPLITIIAVLFMLPSCNGNDNPQDSLCDATASIIDMETFQTINLYASINEVVLEGDCLKIRYNRQKVG